MLLAKSDYIMQRLLQGTKSKNLSALGKALDITPQAIYDARKKDRIPESWIKRASEKFDLDQDWLLCKDISSMIDVLQVNDQSMGVVPFTPHTYNFAKIESKLAQIEKQRDELSIENRKLHEEKAQLLIQIADLREKIARLEINKNELKL